VPEPKKDQKAEQKKAPKPAPKRVPRNAKTCKVKGCKRPYRAKGYCNAHFHKWRGGDLPKARYSTCNHGVKKLKHGEKKECLKKVFKAGLCEAHYQAKFAKKAPAAAAAEPTTPTAPATPAQPS
jgi:hypothetical protein